MSNNTIYVQIECHSYGCVKTLLMEVTNARQDQPVMLPIKWNNGGETREVSLCKYGDNVKYSQSEIEKWDIQRSR